MPRYHVECKDLGGFAIEGEDMVLALFDANLQVNNNSLYSGHPVIGIRVIENILEE